MGQPFDVVAYAYRADMYCGDCTVTLVRRNYSGWIGEPVRNTHYASFEHELQDLAKELGYAWENEYSYDSDEFPKVIFRDQIEEHEFCSECHTELN